MSKSQKELLKEAKELAQSHQEKKEVIYSILSNLDKEEKVSDKHITGMATINEILKEMKNIEDEHEKIIEQIKKK